MKRREWMLLVVALLLIGGSAVALKYLKANQRLGLPGVKTSPREGTVRLQIDMPTNVPGYQVEVLDASASEEALPRDTSIASVGYKSADANVAPITATTVLMGTDRTSIHKPDFCLPGTGWTIDYDRSAPAVVHFDQPESVDLPVMKMLCSRTADVNGQPVLFSGIYVYWFVADKKVTAEHRERMWSMAESLVRKGELQRWAYISYFTHCLPGREEAAFDQIKKLMNLTVPEFQLAWPAADKPGQSGL